MMENLDLYIAEIKMLGSMLNEGKVNIFKDIANGFHYRIVYIGDFRFVFEYRCEKFIALYIRKAADDPGESFKTVDVVRDKSKVIEKIHSSFIA